MEIAKQQSLQSTKEAERSTMIQSFRNLDLALAQAKQDSLSECNNDKRTSYHNTGDMLQSFRDLDEATAQAIQNSLSDKGRCMFESFRNLDGALDQAMMDSLNHCANGDKKKSTSKSRGQKIDTVYESDFDDLEDAIKLAMDASLRDEDNGNAMDGSFKSCGNVGKLGDSAIGKGDYQYLAQLYEEGAASSSHQRGSQLDDQMLKKEGRRRSSHGDLGGEEGGCPWETNSEPLSRVEHVAEPAPNLSRLARRHANQRLAKDRKAASLNYGDLERALVDENARLTSSATRGPSLVSGINHNNINSNNNTSSASNSVDNSLGDTNNGSGENNSNNDASGRTSRTRIRRSSSEVQSSSEAHCRRTSLGGIRRSDGGSSMSRSSASMRRASENSNSSGHSRRRRASEKSLSSSGHSRSSFKASESGSGDDFLFGFDPAPLVEGEEAIHLSSDNRRKARAARASKMEERLKDCYAVKSSTSRRKEKDKKKREGKKSLAMTLLLGGGKKKESR